MYVLQVQVGDGRPVYELTGSWLIPGFRKGRDWVGMLQPGMTLPVKVRADDAENVAIDWDAFEASGGEKVVTEAWQRSPDSSAAVSAQAMSHSAAGDDDAMPPDNASPRDMLESQRRKGHVDQATYHAIIAANPNMK